MASIVSRSQPGFSVLFVGAENKKRKKAGWLRETMVSRSDFMATAGSCSLDEWKGMWTKGVTPWHINHVDKYV